MGHDLLQGREAAIVHVWRRERDVAKGRGLELPPVQGVERDPFTSRIVRMVQFQARVMETTVREVEAAMTSPAASTQEPTVEIICPVWYMGR